jgi:hypothetical protein
MLPKRESEDYDTILFSRLRTRTATTPSLSVFITKGSTIWATRVPKTLEGHPPTPSQRLSGPGQRVQQWLNWPEVLLAAKSYGSVFYDKWSRLNSRGRWYRNHVAMAFEELVSSFRRAVIVWNAKPGLASKAPHVPYSTHCRPPS